MTKDKHPHRLKVKVWIEDGNSTEILNGPHGFEVSMPNYEDMGRSDEGVEKAIEVYSELLKPGFAALDIPKDPQPYAIVHVRCESFCNSCGRDGMVRFEFGADLYHNLAMLKQEGKLNGRDFDEAFAELLPQQTAAHVLIGLVKGRMGEGLGSLLSMLRSD